MPAAAAVSEDDVGAGVVEAGTGSCVVEAIVAAAVEEEEIEELVRAAAFVVPCGDVAVEAQLEIAVPV